MNYNSHDSIKNMIFNPSYIMNEENFCQDTCLTNHTDIIPEDNKNAQLQKRKSRQRNSATRSMFMKIGKFLREPVEDPIYHISNFEAIKHPKNNKKLNIIGSGAFGVVYTARNKTDGKTYAIKRMHKNKIVETGHSLDIIYREISIHTRLIHENIVRAYSHHEDEKYIYLILDHVNSGTLFDVIKNTNGIDEKVAFKYFIQTVSAVNFLHENNLIHRDLKPENLLTDEQQNLKLCDFGWCVDIKEGHRITFCGTYEYMAPEVYQQLPYDFSIDVWTLGILLYELIHGYSPFRASDEHSLDASEEIDSFDEIYNNIINHDLKFDKGISAHCEDMIRKLLSPNLKKRMKIKEIYSHPWVQEFEKEFKSEKIKRMMSEQEENPFESISNTKSNKIEKLIEKVDVEKDSLCIQTNNAINVSSYNTGGYNHAYSTQNKISEKIQIFEKKNLNLNLNLISKNKNEKPIKLSSMNDCERPPLYKGGANFKKEKIENIVNNKLTQTTAKETIKSRNRSCIGNLRNSKQKEKPYQSLHSVSIISNQSDKDNLFDKVLDKIQNQNCSKKNKNKSLYSQNNIFNWEEDTSRINLNENLNLNSSRRNVEEVYQNSENYSGTYTKVKSNNDEYDLLDENYSRKKKSDFFKIKTEENLLENEFYDKKDKIRNRSFNCNRPISVMKFKKIDTDSNSYNKNYRNFLGADNSGKNVDLSRELDLSFVPKDCLYNGNTYHNSNKNLIAAIETLEQAQFETRKKIVQKPKENFWSKVGDFLNPFKCVKDN